MYFYIIELNFEHLDAKKLHMKIFFEYIEQSRAGRIFSNYRIEQAGISKPLRILPADPVICQKTAERINFANLPPRVVFWNLYIMQLVVVNNTFTLTRSLSHTHTHPHTAIHSRRAFRVISFRSPEKSRRSARELCMRVEPTIDVWSPLIMIIIIALITAGKRRREEEGKRAREVGGEKLINGGNSIVPQLQPLMVCERARNGDDSESWKERRAAS